MQSLPAIITPKQLQDRLANSDDALNPLLIIDLCQTDSFKDKCIDGAVHVPPGKLTFGNKPVTGLLPPQHALQNLFRHIGLTRKSQVVVYDDAESTWAARMIWTLDVIGHSTASLLDGGIKTWVKEGFQLASTYRKAKPSNLSIEIDPTLVIDKNYILDALNHNQLKIWDARSFDEYNGSKALARRAGHIPGATHYEWKRLLDKNGHIRNLESIKKELLALGLEPDNDVITHCQTHRRSALTYFVAKKLLSYKNIKAYPGSWAEWGNADETPIAN